MDKQASRGGWADRRLTSLEVEVLRISATGKGIVEVAEHLGMTPDDVRAHVISAMLALGVGTKLEAIIAALRAGLINLERPR